MFQKKYTIEKLERESIYQSVRNKYNTLPIVIIDDEGLGDIKINSLKSRGYNIVEFPDVTHINALDSYQIIISDVNGVGSAISPNDEGIGLIKLIAKNYPYKGLAVYSGSTHNLPSLPPEVMVIQKDDDIETWSEKIDDLIYSVSNPLAVWRRFAKILIDNGITSKELSNIENAYVRSILKGKSPAEIQNIKLHTSDDVKNVVDNLISNGIFFALTKLFGF